MPNIRKAAAYTHQALLDLAMRGARAAGAELMSRYGHVQGLDTKSSSTDPVSDADRAAERILVELITGERPDDGVLRRSAHTPRRSKEPLKSPARTNR